MLLGGCNHEFEDNAGRRVSSSVDAALEKKVFLSEYNISSVKMCDNNFNFPFSMIWLEKKWSVSYDSRENEIINIFNSPPVLVFTLNNNDSLKGSNYLEKWFLADTDSSTSGVIGGMINLDLKNEGIPDSFHLTLYKLSSPYDYKDNLITIGEFLIKRK
jgi:hypothetical protein